MALPQLIKVNDVTGASSPDLIDNDLNAGIKQPLLDIFGIPDNTSITVAGTVFVAGGLDEVIFRNAVADASATGRLRRNAANLTFHDGTAARTTVWTATAQTLTDKTLTSPVINTSYLGTAILGAVRGGTGVDTSASTGVPSIAAGVWSAAATLATTLGGTGVNTSARFKVVTATFDLSTASGVQNIAHGITGTPLAVVVFAVVNATTIMSVGLADGTTSDGIGNTGGGINFINNSSVALKIAIEAAQTNTQTAIITFNATNVILTWTKAGTPTGSLAEKVLVFF